MTSHDKPSTRGFACLNDLGYEDQACKEVRMLLKNNFNPLWSPMAQQSLAAQKFACMPKAMVDHHFSGS